MAMRTITLKLHKPSKRKSRIIDEAMTNYTLAYQFLLDKAYWQIDEIRKRYRDARGNYRAANIQKWVDKDISKELNRFEIECFKDSLKMDFGMTMASYLRLREIQNDAGYPVAYLNSCASEDRYSLIMQQLTEGKKTLEECEKEIDKLNDKTSLLKPIFFCRYALNRDYCLLYDAENNRYFAKFYMMNVKSNDRAVTNTNKERKLQYIHKSEEIYVGTGRPERFILVPLSFGRWQEEYLKRAVNNPGILKTARLMKRKGEYFLSISVDIGSMQRIKPASYMGVARGIKNAVNYTVVNLKGDLLDSGSINADVRHEKTGDIISGDIHKIANAIEGIALKNSSQLIMHTFTNKGDKLQWVDGEGFGYVPLMNCQSYNRLDEILKYKLAHKGLPRPVQTSPVGLFYTCPECGLNSLGNRLSESMFICIACGTAMDIEKLGSINLSRRLIKYNKAGIEVKLERTESGIKFINEDLNLNFTPSDPLNCIDEFRNEIKRIIEDFYRNISKKQKDRNFNKKYGIIKRMDRAEDFIKLIKIVE